MTLTNQYVDLNVFKHKMGSKINTLIEHDLKTAYGAGDTRELCENVACNDDVLKVGGMAQQFRALALLANDPRSVPSILYL